MKIALISTPTRTHSPNLIMPLGIMYLASYLEQLGHTVKIIDIARTRQSNNVTIDELSKSKPDLIGISGIITAFRFVNELVRDLKKAFPDIPVVIGGHIVLDNYEMLLKSTGCDYTITGYGEKPLSYLVEHLEKKRDIDDIPGLSYLKKGEVVHNPNYAFVDDMDSIPLPAYHLIDMEYYITVYKKNPKLEAYLAKSGKPAPPMRSATVIAARGCTDQCSFCVHEFEHKGFMVHSIAYVINNIRFLYEKYHARIFGLGEDLFLYSAEQATQLVNAMNAEFPDAYFYCSTRADYVVRQGLADVLKNSNCFYMAYGFESGSNDMLKILNKRMTRDINVAAYKTISKTNIYPACSFMVGTPGETKETIKETIDAIKDARIVDSAVFFTTPYPGSRLFRWCVEQGLIKDVESYLDFISNRDATTLSINFTPYPDIIVKMMQIVVQNALEDNKRQNDKRFKIPIKNLVIGHWIVPLLYESYFSGRKALSLIFSKYRRDTIKLNLNKRSTVMLSMDSH